MGLHIDDAVAEVCRKYQINFGTQQCYEGNTILKNTAT